MNDMLTRSLDDLAGRADQPAAPGLLPGIHAKARRNRRRKQVAGAGVTALAAAALIGGLSLQQDAARTQGPGYASDPGGTAASPSAPQPAGFSITDVHVQRGADGVSVRYRLSGDSAAWTDPITGRIIRQNEPGGTELLVGGQPVGGTDGGGKVCEPTDVVQSYDARFGTAREPILLGPQPAGATLHIEATYCMPGGKVATAVKEVRLP